VGQRLRDRVERLACSAFVAFSLGGFLARPGVGPDGLEEGNGTIPRGEGCGNRPFFSSVDALVMGRKTFETVWGFPAWPYGEKPVVVQSRSFRRLPT
jgi:hypothetical protein